MLISFSLKAIRSDRETGLVLSRSDLGYFEAPTLEDGWAVLRPHLTGDPAVSWHVEHSSWNNLAAGVFVYFTNREGGWFWTGDAGSAEMAYRNAAGERGWTR